MSDFSAIDPDSPSRMSLLAAVYSYFGGIQITTGYFSPKPDLSLTNTLFPIPQTGFRQYLDFPGNPANLGLDSNDLGGFDLYSAPIFGPGIGDPRLDSGFEPTYVFAVETGLSRRAEQPINRYENIKKNVLGDINQRKCKSH